MAFGSDDGNPWSLRPALDFLRESRADGSNSAIPSDPTIPNIALFNPKSAAPKSLGDFDRLLSFCGKAIGIPLPHTAAAPHLFSNASSSSPSDQSTLPSSTPEDNAHITEDTSFDEIVARKEVRWKDQVGNIQGGHGRRKSKKSSGALGLVPSCLLQAEGSGFESDTEEDDYDFDDYSGQRASSTSKAHTGRVRTRSSLSPLAPPFDPDHELQSSKRSLPTPQLFLDPREFQPLFHLTMGEQEKKLVKKIAKRFRHEVDSTISTIPSKCVRHPHTDPRGIHVFIDLSNIVIGFQDRLKLNRGLTKCTYMKHPSFSFHSLSLILERGRLVARRVAVGSKESTVMQKTPDHFLSAEVCGYELNILERVKKPQVIRPKRRTGGTGSGYATSGYSSQSDTQFSGKPTMKEQGVDEILQMKLLESLVDSDHPSTIVLASGDAAEAEYSGGFLKNVERALDKGWKVEVVAWSEGLSKEYYRQGFLQRYQGKFKIITLDDFCEEMLAIYVQKYKLCDSS